MWLFTKYGFYSVVLKPDGQFQLRARVKRHLLMLKSRFGLGKQYPVIETEHGDYRFRMVMQQEHFSNIASALVSEIDYDNFKNECHEIGDHAYDRALMRVWSIMNAMQGEETPRQPFMSPQSRYERRQEDTRPAIEDTDISEGLNIDDLEDIWANDDVDDTDDDVEEDDDAEDEVPPTTYPPAPGSWSKRVEEGPFEV